MANHIEEAKSGRASCRTCKKSIGKGELRLGVEVASQFSDAQVQWHHLACAADKLPVELREALASYTGDVPERAALEQHMADAIAKGHAKPAGFPYVDHAPTGRAKCQQCGESIEKGSLRVAVERDIEAGGMPTKGAGYMHPKCVKANQFETDGGLAAIVADVRVNSRLPAAELASAIAAIEAGDA
jgi:poly [ADP-ribose] polymerase